jgi:hypothetical protein
MKIIQCGRILGDDGNSLEVASKSVMANNVMAYAKPAYIFVHPGPNLRNT